MATATDFDEARRAHGDSAVVRAIDTARRPVGDDEPPAYLDEAAAALYGESAVVRPIAAGRPAAAKKLQATPYVWQDPETIEPRDWLVGRVLLRGQAHGKVAPGGYGKTFHTVAQALSIVTGRPLLGHQVWGGPGRAWIWNLEDPTIELTRAIQAACKLWDIKREDIEGRLFVDSAMDGATLKMATVTQEGLVINRPLVDQLAAELIERKIDYLDVDPFVSSHGVDENDNVQIDAVTKEWAAVAHKSGTAISLTHHIKKTGGGEVTAEMARGAVSFVAALRSTFVMNRMGPEDAKTWGIDPLQRRRYVRIYDDKGNRTPPAASSDWYYLESVDLNNGPADGSRPSDNIGAMIPWSPPDAFDGITPEHLQRAQAAIAAGEWREDSQSPAWVGHAIGPIIGKCADKGKEHEADRAALRKIVAHWIANGALVIDRYADAKGLARAWVKVGEIANA